MHVLSDAAGSVAVVIGAIVIHYTSLYWLDTLIAILLAFLVTYWDGIFCAIV